MTAIPPPVSGTAAWTEQDERELQRNALATDLGYGDEFVYRLARAFLRLRTENERLTKHVEWLRENARAMDWHGGLLRAEALRATRERETPPDDSPNSLGVQLAALEARDFQRINDPRSRVSDNG